MRTKKLFEDEPLYPLYLVDSDEDLAITLARFLKDKGWQVFLFKDLSEIEKLLREDRELPRIVLCERYGTGSDIELVLEAKEATNTSIVLMSEIPAPGDVAEAMKLGVDDYIFKPVENWERLNRVLLRAGQRLHSRMSAAEESERLSKLADWNAWKAGFLKSDTEGDMKQLLRNLHVQLNQDANYSHLLSIAESMMNMEREETPVPTDFFALLMAALRPVARLSDGIGVAAAILGDKPRLLSVQLKDFVDDVRKGWRERWKAESAKRQHKFEFWVSPELRKYGKQWLEVDKEAMLKALNELVVNALKHSDSGSPVTISFEANPQRFEVTVTNPPSVKQAVIGQECFRGVPREYEPQAFRLFVRLREETITLYEEDWPMGLGLPLARAVIKGAEGEFYVHNEVWHSSGQAEPTVLVTGRVTLPLRSEARFEATRKVEGDVADGIELF